MQNVVSDYLKTIKNVNTNRSYRKAIMEWMDFATQAGIDFIEGEARAIHMALDEFLWDAKWKESTAKQRLAVLSSFYSWLVNMDIRTSNPAGTIKVPTLSAPKEPKQITAKMLDTIHAYLVRASKKDKTLYRSLAIYYILREGGLRVSELVNLNLEDVQYNGTVTVRNGKRGKARRTAISQPAAQFIIRTYAANNNIKDGDKLCNITTRYVSYLLNDMAKKAGLSEHDIKLCASPHAWRHFWTTSHIENGTNPMTLQLMGGWTKGDMVAYYANKLHYKPCAVEV